MHYGVLGMKWGVRKDRDKSSFDTTYRRTGLTKPRGLRGERIAYTEGHKSITNRKAERAALKEGKAYRKTYGNKANEKDELSVIGNKYDEIAKKGSKKVQKAQNKYTSKADEQVKKHFNNSSSLKKILDSRIDNITELKLDKDTKNAYNYEMRRSIDSAKKWIKTKNDIMSMNLSEVSANDIKNRYKDTYRKYGASYYPF